MAQTLICQAILATAVVYAIRRWLGKPGSGYPLPPGPPAYPLIGHLGVLPQYAAERAFAQWSKEYGSDVLYFNVFGQSIVVLNSVKAAEDLLDKRGAIYSDRPPFTYFDLMGWHDNLPFLSSKDPRFPVHRRIFQNDFSKTESRKYEEIQLLEVRKLVKSLVEKSQDWQRLFRTFTVAVTIRVLTGHEIKSSDDNYVKYTDDITKAATEGGAPGATGVDILPWLIHLPTWCDPTGSTALIHKWKHAKHKMNTVPYTRVVQEMNDGTAKPSFLRSVLEEEERRSQSGEPRLLTEKGIQGVSGAVYTAAQETTLDSLTIFIFAIVNHPEVQEKAKAELEAVVGPTRMPDFADRPHLPYLERIVLETFRFWPVIPIAPHKVTEDDIYEGMFIPKGSTVTYNAYAMAHDETTYSNHWRFNPDRYLSKEDGGLGEPLPEGHFGFGRRVCPGRYMAEASIFIAIASMLHVLTIGKARDEDGREITIDPATAEYTSGLASHPTKVLCNIFPTSDQRANLAMES
ncbi:cytochrome P450 [Schizophyllum amplum]|uniref:Cytochrome P450 n=1 Tax=Schizophyllum amplum TaxID=97359 RepID=A0A550CQC0_9AGAR|nr:cytochrome P450 [Auriculariopsis ampla]